MTAPSDTVSFIVHRHAEELGTLYDAKSYQPVMTKLKARTDKYNAEVVKQSQERSQNWDQ